jgi:hypothetical protein
MGRYDGKEFVANINALSRESLKYSKEAVKYLAMRTYKRLQRRKEINRSLTICTLIYLAKFENGKHFRRHTVRAQSFSIVTGKWQQRNRRYLPQDDHAGRGRTFVLIDRY